MRVVDDDATALHRLTTSLEQRAAAECLDLVIQTLERENPATSSSSSVTSRPAYVSQLARCVFAACSGFEQHVQVRASTLHDTLRQVSALIHDLLFLPISTIESGVS